MFPNGVVYEGVGTEPFKMRGESGANDSMVPLGDNLLELTADMPVNPLTAVLKDFRTYRPRNHREFLEYVQQRASAVGLRKYAMQDATSAALYLANLDQIRAFRHRRESLNLKMKSPPNHLHRHTRHPRPPVFFLYLSFHNAAKHHSPRSPTHGR
jgi:indoleamine 2,3-dioxygenase